MAWWHFPTTMVAVTRKRIVLNCTWSCTKWQMLIQLQILLGYRLKKTTFAKDYFPRHLFSKIVESRLKIRLENCWLPNRLCVLKCSVNVCSEISTKKMQDPRYKHEYLDNGQIWGYGVEDKSYKHLEARVSI